MPDNDAKKILSILFIVVFFMLIPTALFFPNDNDTIEEEKLATTFEVVESVERQVSKYGRRSLKITYYVNVKDKSYQLWMGWGAYRLLPGEGLMKGDSVWIQTDQYSFVASQYRPQEVSVPVYSLKTTDGHGFTVADYNRMKKRTNLTYLFLSNIGAIIMIWSILRKQKK